MVTDVQGWKIKTGQYVLTDPIVFSKEQVLGNVDGGTEYMKKFMAKHKCT